MSGEVFRARAFCVEAEKSPDPQVKHRNFVEASKCYLTAASNVKDTYLQRSLIYLSASCSSKSALYGSVGHAAQASDSMHSSGSPNTESAQNLLSERIIFEAHRKRLSGLERVPARAAVNVNRVARDVAALEAALAKIGERARRELERES
ncbi:hypothetical protein B484DRAFT_405753 [Ochromonadaceae sp. CCMP2298]|nr:hypothetical protein B484DRAFT_405753 [Ochromonadaceae sp. CCMP2298]